MNSNKGQIGVTSKNIFPVIKKFLYSEHDIFLREIVSNAVDATTKLRTLMARGTEVGEANDLRVEVILDKESKTLTIRDFGIGMTADEVDRYINQIAFSGAEDFLEKYKDASGNIIGHFGLGFYSAFMVSKQVEIDTLSYQLNAKPVHWSCDGSPAYEMGTGSRTERGTDIIMHLDEESAEFLEKARIEELLTKYCRFLPIPIIFGKKQEWRDGKMQDTDEDNVINDTNPLWLRKPQDLIDNDYKEFYHKLYPGADAPLFWIHLNVDYPFTLTGVLYFPKVNNKIDLQSNKIKLYCNQVFVTDEIESIVPMYLTLLHGVIDSPDIPLNVSRSYLQSDANVKKISSYITKKVADKLEDIMKSDRPTYEAKWPDLSVFIHYGILTDEKMEERALKSLLLLEDVSGKFYTPDEYRELVKSNQTDKDEKLVYLYATDLEAQYSYIHAAEAKGYSVLYMHGMLDTPLLNHLEQKWEGSIRFVRVDSDTVDQLIQRDDTTTDASEHDTEIARNLFDKVLPTGEVNYQVSLRNMGREAQPAVVTRMEWMRRMKEMSQYQPGASFYNSLPNSYALVLNADHPLIQDILRQEGKELEPQLATLRSQLATLKEQLEDLKKDSKDTTTPDKNESSEEQEKRQEQQTALHKQEEQLQEEVKSAFDKYAKEKPVIQHIVELALLSAGELRGAPLQEFIKRTTGLLSPNNPPKK